MTDPTTPSRRQLLRLLASSALAGVLAPTGIDRVLGRPLDQGIGGTGAAPPPTDESDRGIGGTGVIGTIKKFGSIYVNDLRIGYPADAEVLLDGVPASQTDLRIGQVVRVDARGANDALSTRRIFVTSEVVGPVERIGARELVVLGQTVSIEGLPRREYVLGETIGVSGLRRNDGTIVASLIAPRPDALPRVIGPVVQGRNGGLQVGGLPLDRVPPKLIGSRAHLEGRLRGDGVFVVRRGYTDTSLFPKSVRTLSVESYVERRGGAFALGSGFALAGNPGVDIAEGRSVRAVLTTSIDREGRLSVDGVRAGGRNYRVSPGGGGGRGPGGGGRGGGGHGEGGRGGGERGHGDHGRGEHGRGEHGRGHEGGRHGGGEGRHGGGQHGGGGHEGGRTSRESGGRHGFNEGGRGGPGGFHGRPGGAGGFRGGGPGGFRGGGGGPRGFGGGGFRGGGGGGFRGGGGGRGGGHR